MHLFEITLGALGMVGLFVAGVFGQPYGPPDRGQPGDEMIQAYLARQTEAIHQRFLEGVESLEDWQRLGQRYRQEYFYMLGLWPLPDRTPLKASVTGTFEGNGFAVEMIHFQSRPRLYVTANLYRPRSIEPGERLPAVLYVCGHSGNGRNGNKTSFQSHGIWFARHGYICLMLDSLQLGEIAALHHGTYREGRWWWHSRGYTPGGVECWNGVRGIDYLVSRPDVDPERIAVTGISGGGAATFWIAAADERVRAAAPVSGMADLMSYVPNRVINGHCDCMFLYNTFRWPWTRIAALIAPRPLLFVNSDRDRIFPMDANQRVINRLERTYSLYGAGDLVDAVVSIGGHAYRQDIRQAVYRFMNIHLKADPRPVTDSEVDLVTGRGTKRKFPIPPEKLRVFPEDSDIPTDQLNTTIDEYFVPVAKVEVPAGGDFATWKAALKKELRHVSFRTFPERIPPARPTQPPPGQSGRWLETEPSIRIPLEQLAATDTGTPAKRVLLIVAGTDEFDREATWWRAVSRPGDRVLICHPRGIGPTRWTRKNPPNYVERSHVLLGLTVDTGRVWDVAAAARYLHRESGLPVAVAGSGGAGILAAYAALWEPVIAEVVIQGPPATHMDPAAPQFLNVLRVCDIPHTLGLLAPRPLTIHGSDPGNFLTTAAVYKAVGAEARLKILRRR